MWPKTSMQGCSSRIKSKCREQSKFFNRMSCYVTIWGMDSEARQPRSQFCYDIVSPTVEPCAGYLLTPSVPQFSYLPNRGGNRTHLKTFHESKLICTKCLTYGKYFVNITFGNSVSGAIGRWVMCGSFLCDCECLSAPFSCLSKPLLWLSIFMKEYPLLFFFL